MNICPIKRIKSIITSKSILLALVVVFIMVYPIILDVIMDTEVGVSFLFVGILFALPLALLLVSIKSVILFVLALLLFTLSSVIETSMFVIYGSFIIAGNVMAVLTSNYAEGSDFLLSNIHVLLYSIPLWITFVAAWVIKSKSIVEKRGLFALSAFFLALSILFIGYKYFVFYKGRLTVRYYIENRLFTRPPYNVFYQISNVIKLQQQKKYLKESDDFCFNSRREKSFIGREIYVLGIGESCKYDNFSLNGKYKRETTPYLSSTPNVVLFDDYYSAACLTMFSVPQILTRATPENYDLCYREKSIVQPFKECGFKVFVIVSSGNLLSYEKYLSRGADELINVPSDSIIPNKIDSLSSIYDKTFFIVQFLGSHSFYHNYTKDFDRYHPNINDEVKTQSDSLYINAYDNTVLYTDYILHRIMLSIDKNAYGGLIYTSDHGEDVNSTGGGHGGDCTPVKGEFHVPLVVWASKCWIDDNNVKFMALSKNKSRKVNSDNVFYSMCDMAGIELGKETSNITYSIFSEKLEERRRKVLVPDGVNFIDVDE